MYRRSSTFRLRRRSLALGLASSCAALSLSWRAAAQAEAQKPTPNVLLLVDSSGSMEFKTDGTFPTCTPGDTSVGQRSRWIQLVEVLTGTINDYSCWAQDRNSPAFKDEFTLDSSVVPYDFGYVNPYHRALSNSCIYGPGVLPPQSTPFLFPPGAVTTYPFASGAVSRTQPGGCSLDFDQSADGLLDIYKDEVRFGLMTFDARVSGGTGVNSSTLAANYVTGMDGNWSYPPLGPTRQGHPANCTTPFDQEVGARNAAAPPWEGRMVAFGPPDLQDNTERNGWIQEVLLSTRPYGATPIAGQLFDAQHFFWNDHDPDPFNSATEDYEFGPRIDPNWGAANCRKSILILLTDGEPNLDLRPYCEAQPPDVVTGGECPYDKPEEIVAQLRDESPEGGRYPVETYVIGFALGSVKPNHGPGSPTVECKDLDLEAECDRPENNDFVAYPDGKAVQACCTLNEIAAAGGFDHTGVTRRRAYFANNSTELKAIFTDILDDVVQVATRTMPVFSSSGGDSQSNGFKFFSAFDPQPDPAEPQLWQGKLERRRFVCEELQPKEKYDPDKGDDFALNVNENGGDRHFYTVIGSGIDHLDSIRPELVLDNDGLGLSSGTLVSTTNPGGLKGIVTASAMQLTDTTCDEASTANDCRDLILDHLVGMTPPGKPNRCPDSVCRLFGGIYHSTPTVVPGKPGEFLRDESYQAFGGVMAADKRPSVLYTSTVDGFLHAFNLAPFPGSEGAADREIKGPGNNELWSFIPPAVLPNLKAQYPSTPAFLLDGVPIIKDVVATGTTRFERLAADAQAGTGAWRSVLLQGFGEGQVKGGYFALDITKPDDGNGGAPRFLWQLTRDADGKALFGDGGTPLITTVFVNAANGGAREVAVAVLPGGDVASPGGQAATSGTQTGTDPASFQTDRKGRSYANVDPDDNRERARSLTIVRLDTGEVIRTFRPATGVGSFSTTVFSATDIPAPITGQPKAYPENTGAVADRIFVGDRDGRLWRVDVSSKDPADWSMKIFFDAFYDGDFEDSQPVVLPPVLSVTETGAVTVNFATGDQQATSAPATMVNRVVSLTEQLNTSNDFVAHVNWIHELTDADRVTGPMVLFNTGLYYAVSRPPATTANAACDVGRSKVFGTHYLESADTQAETEPANPLSGPGKAPGVPDKLIASRSDGLIFGLSLQAEPTCSSSPEVISGNESFGTQTVSMSKTVNPGKMFLSYNVSGTSAGSSGVEQVKTELADPNIPVTFQSWALVYE